MVLDYVILVLYALSMVAIAIYTHNRSKSVDDFLLAGKKGLNGWMSAFAYGTTYFSAVIFIGYAGKFGTSFGLASIWIGVGNAILGSLIAWKILAKRTKNMTARLSAKTMPQFFERRYASKNLKIVSAIVIFIFLIPYSASVYNGLSSLFEIVFGIEGWIIMVCLALLTAVYLFFGGYFATALSDFIQGIIMIIGVVVMFVLFMNHSNVGWDLSELASDVTKTWFTFSNPADATKGIYGPTVTLISLILLTSMGVWGLPQTVHKYYAIRDKKAINQGVIVSTLFALLIGFIAYFIGALSYYFAGDIVMTNPDNIIPQMIAFVIPTGVIGVIAVLILSASMSTLSSVSLASASVVAVDLYKGVMKKEASDKQTNIVMRVLCLLFIAISVILAVLNEEFGISAIAYMMGLSWGTLSGCFIGPFVIGMISKKVTEKSCWASIIGSLVITVALVIVLGFDQNGWSCSFGTAIVSGISSSPLIGVICMAYSLIVTVVVSAFTKKPNDQVLFDAFDKPLENEIK